VRKTHNNNDRSERSLPRAPVGKVRHEGVAERGYEKLLSSVPPGSLCQTRKARTCGYLESTERSVPGSGRQAFTRVPGEERRMHGVPSGEKGV